MRLCVALLLACLTASSAPAEVPSVFLTGETLDFNLAWTRISGGSARMTIAPIDGERFRITSVGKSGAFFSRFFRVRDEIESIVDRETFSTLQYHKLLDERGKKKDELTVVDESRSIATRKGKTISVPRPIYDPISLLYYLRTLDLTPGQIHIFTLLADGKVYTVQARVREGETVTTPAGTFRTVVVEPEMHGTGVFRDDQNRLLIWYSASPPHLPVRIQSEVNIGTITATLRAVREGVGSTEPVTSRGQ